jgi:uncharacterized membrane protein
MLFIVGASLIALIIILPTLGYNSQPIALLVILASLLAIFADIYILYKDVAKKPITHKKFRLIPCHRGFVFFGKEFILCFRCLGFYIGNLLWGILTAMDQYIWNDFLMSFGLTYYLILLFGVIATVPIHGAWLRSHPSKAKKQNILRSIIGFIFSASLWLIGGLIIYLIRGL